MAAQNTQTYTMNGSIERICQLLKDPQFCIAFKLKQEMEAGGPLGITYRFSSGVTMTSWGEKITITLSPAGPETTAVMIQSECALPTQIIDWGKNKTNVNNIFHYLSGRLSAPAAQGAGYAQAPADNRQQPSAQGTVYCKNCGTAIVAGGAFCSTCGTKAE